MRPFPEFEQYYLYMNPYNEFVVIIPEYMKEDFIKDFTRIAQTAPVLIESSYRVTDLQLLASLYKKDELVDARLN